MLCRKARPGDLQAEASYDGVSTPRPVAGRVHFEMQARLARCTWSSKEADGSRDGHGCLLAI